MRIQMPEVVFPYRETTFEEFAQANKLTLGQAARALERLAKSRQLAVSKNREGRYVYRLVRS